MGDADRDTSRYNFDAAGVDYIAGGWSINALANKYAIPEATLRRHARKYAWVQGSSDIKREMVREAMAGLPLAGYDERVTNTLTDSAVRQLRLDAATQDVADMELGLTVARTCMLKLLAMFDQVEHPKEVKLIAEANKVAVDTIRKIRSLDVDDGPEATVSVDIGDGFAELRAAFRKRLAAPAGEEADAETEAA